MTPELHRQFENSLPYDMIKEIKSMFEKQAGVERFDLLQTFHACKQEEGKPVVAYALQMKGYADQLECLGYMLPQDLIVGLILNGLTKDFAGFVRNYNMHNVGKTIGELHAMLIEYEKDNYHYAPSITRCVVSVHRLVENRFVQCFTDFGISVSKNNVHYFNAIPSNCIYEIDMHDLVPNVNYIYSVSTKRAKHNLDSTYLWHCRLDHISKKRIENLQHEGLLRSTDDESFDQCVSCLSGKMTRRSFPHRPKRATDLLGIIHTDVCGLLRHVLRQGASYFITFLDDYSHYGYVYLLKHKHEVFKTFKVFKNEVENQLGKTIKAFQTDRGGEYISQEFKDYLKACGIVDKTPYELWYEKVPNLSYLKVWGCEALVKRDTPDKLQQIFVKCIIIGYLKKTIDLEEIQDEDTSPSEITSKIPVEVEGFEPPQEEVIPIRRSERTHRAPNSLCLNIEVDEHSLGDLNEPASYKAAMLDLNSNKWIDAMNAEIQSMIDNMVWVLVDLPPNCKTAGSKWIFKKKADMDDDIIIMGSHIPSLQSVKDYLGKCFAMKDLGEAAFILEIKIYRDRSKRLIRHGQNAYVDKILKRYKMDNSKCGHIPMQEKLELNKTQGASTPKETAMKNILNYLRNTKYMFLVYGGNSEAELRVDCYCNAGFETDRDDTKSQIGYVLILNGGAVD
nr:retrotransposon protein, putative, Ty1-copia subclass [Tanacetum cinerariifolium]